MQAQIDVVAGGNIDHTAVVGVGIAVVVVGAVVAVVKWIQIWCPEAGQTFPKINDIYQYFFGPIFLDLQRSVFISRNIRTLFLLIIKESRKK